MNHSPPTQFLNKVLKFTHGFKILGKDKYLLLLFDKVVKS